MKKQMHYICLVLLLAVGLSACRDNSEQFYLQSCGTSVEFFDHPPMLLSEMDGITPLGTLNPPHHTLPTAHTYMNFQQQFTPGNIYSPGNVTLKSITVTRWLVSNFRQGHEDYSLQMSPCSDVDMTYGHVTFLEQNLLDAIEWGACSTRTTIHETVEECNATVNMPLESGQLIGQAGQIGPGIDWGLRDSRLNHVYANDARVGHMKTVACPIHYYQAGMRSDLEAKLYGVTPAYCGELNYDLLGTASGMWFLPSTPTTGYIEGFALVLGYDNLDPTRPGFSIAQLGSELDNSVQYFTPAHSGYVNRAFHEVTDDNNVYCYDLGMDSILVQLQSSGSLKFEAIQGGDCSGNPQFSASALDFIR